ncbi:MAG: hypothetical protein FWB96_07545 [Defluviitaleaceae bacterium]|nr:hypothetical protein [Defluviitaleaceae bacterium]MCL2262779.1 hypothetical protein [Defluviitaleaceae bacterium]
MDEKMFGDLMLSLNQALDYAKGDKEKCRSMIADIPEEEIERRQLFFQKFESLSESKKQRAIIYVDELFGA